MQHNFFYAESLMHSRYTYKKIGLLVDSERVCAFVGRCREKNLKCRLTELGSGDGAPSRRKQGGLGAEPPAFGDFYNFPMKITRF